MGVFRRKYSRGKIAFIPIRQAHCNLSCAINALVVGFRLPAGASLIL